MTDLDGSAGFRVTNKKVARRERGPGYAAPGKNAAGEFKQARTTADK